MNIIYKKTEFYLHFFRNAISLQQNIVFMLITNDPEKEKDVIRLRFRLFVRFSLCLILFWLLAVAVLAVVQCY